MTTNTMNATIGARITIKIGHLIGTVRVLEQTAAWLESRGQTPAQARLVKGTQPKPNTTMSNNITNIRTGNDELRIWEQDNGKFGWATPNGSQGGDEDSFDVAVKEAFDAEGLNATEYGY